MCSRYTFFTPMEQAEKHLQARAVPMVDWQPAYNAAPGQWLPVITNEFSQIIQFLQWGLVPQWAKNQRLSHSLYNIAAEQITEKPAFQSIFRYKRCVVPANGWYAWGAAPTPYPGKAAPAVKQPYHFHLKGGGLMLMAGIWDVWGEGLNSFSIITTRANADVSVVHKSMPVLLKASEAKQWLFKGAGGNDLLQLLRAAEKGAVQYYPVHTRLKTVLDNDPSLIEKVELPKPPPRLFD